MKLVLTSNGFENKKIGKYFASLLDTEIKRWYNYLKYEMPNF